jgi:hypothetical protein
MVISSRDMQDIFFREIKAGQLIGTVTPSVLRQGLMRMKEAMIARGANAQDLDLLKRKIDAAITEYSWRSNDYDQRDAAKDALIAVFDDMVRQEKPQAINCLFLGGVRFD